MNSFKYLFEALPWLGFCTAVLLAWYFYLKARNKERMALIEKGADVSDIYSKQELTFRFPWLKFGIIITGISIGVSLVVLLMILMPHHDILGDPGPLLIILGALFGGIAMIIAHFVDKPRKKE
jgi:membrane associated rhomboid family serine protease